MKNVHIHLLSDSTGETVTLISRACLAQFEEIEATEHIWNMVRNEEQVREVLAGIEANPGFVLYTMLDVDLREILEDGCRKQNIPCVPAIDPVVVALGSHLGEETHGRPGRQHEMNAEYFNRIDAMQYVLAHDDGQATWDLGRADVLILGVSRTSKTPTCIYLANRGIKAANIPIVPGCPLPDDVLSTDIPLVVGLTKDPKRLVQIRRNRLRMLNQDEETDYIDIETVTQEVNAARRMFTQNNWPIIDVTRRSIEETAATILQMHARKVEQTA